MGSPDTHVSGLFFPATTVAAVPFRLIPSRLMSSS